MNEKSVLEQLVANNTKLSATNEELVAIFKKMSNENKDIQRETYLLKKQGGSATTQGKRDPTLWPYCKKECCHEPDACFEIEKKKYKRPTSWKYGCDGVGPSARSSSVNMK